jgi:hypothetical protein
VEAQFMHIRGRGRVVSMSNCNSRIEGVVTHFPFNKAHLKSERYRYVVTAALKVNISSQEEDNIVIREGLVKAAFLD